GNNAPAVALLCRQLGGPTFSFTVHGQEDFDTFREKASHASFLVAISSFGRAQYYRRLDQRDWSKVHVVRCGLDPELLTAPLTPVPEARRLVCVARLSPEKGHLVVMEALALGRPAICSAISGIPELVLPGLTGWLVPAASVEALVRAMREALEAPRAQLETMGRAGAALVAERHDVRREARRLLEL